MAFYTTTLGFTLTERRDDLQFAHVASNVPGLEIGLNQIPAPKGSVVIPAKVALAAFADADGNVLRLAGPPETVTPSR